MPAPFRYDRTFPLTVSPAELWDVLARTDRYETWWPWLHELEGAGLEPGAIARCVVQAPLPYALRFAVEVVAVTPHERVDTKVTGDLVGPASLAVLPAPGGCDARLTWELHLEDPVLRPLVWVARPAMAWAHDRVVDMGLDQFRERAIDARPMSKPDEQADGWA